MPTSYIRRGADLRSGQTGTAAASPIYVDSDIAQVKVVPGSSGTTEVTLADLSTAQTLTSKTLTSPTITGATMTTTTLTSPTITTPVITGDKPSVLSGTALHSAGLISMTAAQSGSVLLMDKADGLVITLPAAVAGYKFTFHVTVTITSNSYKVITFAGTELIVGSLFGIDTDTANALVAYPSLVGTSNIAVTQQAAGTNATGGIKGSQFTLTCDSATVWNVSGVILGAGTVATSFATS